MPDSPRFLHVEVLGVQLLHIEWGITPPEPEQVTDMPQPMQIGFHQPYAPDEYRPYAPDEID